jgi:hypothetical protein
MVLGGSSVIILPHDGLQRDGWDGLRVWKKNRSGTTGTVSEGSYGTSSCAETEESTSSSSQEGAEGPDGQEGFLGPGFCGEHTSQWLGDQVDRRARRASVLSTV